MEVMQHVFPFQHYGPAFLSGHYYYCCSSGFCLLLCVKVGGRRRRGVQAALAVCARRGEAILIGSSARMYV